MARFDAAQEKASFIPGIPSVGTHGANQETRPHDCTTRSFDLRVIEQVLNTEAFVANLTVSLHPTLDAKFEFVDSASVEGAVTGRPACTARAAQYAFACRAA